jgi:hypothetical protein
MSKQVLEAPLRPEEQLATSITGRIQALKKRQPSVFWPWLGGLLLVGLVIVGVVTFSAWNWLNGIQRGITVTQPSSTAISMINVGRSAIYADLTVTLVNIQYAASFSDDPIHVGQATVRATVQIKNTAQGSISLAYYDITRLLVPKQQPIAPTNLNLPAAPKAGSTQNGWIDFPVAENTALNTLKLQFGNASTNQTLVTIPVSGSYNATQFNDHLYHPSSSPMNYYYGHYLLIYHLDSVDVRYSYNGTEVNTGQQFYVLNFTVDNPNSVWVSPGYGFDYLRLVLSSNRPPVYATLPIGFKANAHGMSGSVVYAAPAGLHNLALAFLAQFYQGQSSYSIAL